MIERIISGGQTGADQGAWRAAKRFGIPCGGWMPKGFLTEDGPRPEFAELYGAAETKSSSYPVRTRMNVFGSDGTLIFDTVNAKKLEDLSRGSQLTIRAAMEYGRPNLTSVVVFGKPIEPKRPACIVDWIAEHGIRVLNIAGNRESRSPGIGFAGKGEKCCDRAGESNGYYDDGPLLFTCPKHCSCHEYTHD